jgi:hypothetical protein
MDLGSVAGKSLRYSNYRTVQTRLGELAAALRERVAG